MSQPWEPANDTERTMAQAMATGDAAGYFRALALAELYLPQVVGGDPADGQRLLTANLFGQTCLLVFTSVETMVAHASAVADGYTMTNYAELRRKWPDPGWRLAVNVGSPIDAYVPVEAAEAAAVGDLVIPTAAEALAEAAREEAEGATSVGATSVDVDGYVETLLDLVVRLPTARDVADPNDILAPDFPWRSVGPPGASAIEVFTSEDLFAQAFPHPVPSVVVALAVVLSMWPEGHRLAVDPRTPQALELDSDHVQMLLLWGDSDDVDGDSS